MGSQRGNLQNLTAPRFQPGQSGNPGGRPKKKLTDKLEARLDTPIPGDKNGRTYGDLFIEKLVRRACNRSDTAAKEIFDRVEGKALQRMELSGPEGGPVEVSSEDLARRIREILNKARARAGKPPLPEE